MNCWEAIAACGVACCATVILVSVTIITIKPLLSVAVWSSLRCHCGLTGSCVFYIRALLMAMGCKGSSCRTRQVLMPVCTGSALVRIVSRCSRFLSVVSAQPLVLFLKNCLQLLPLRIHSNGHLFTLISIVMSA